MTFPTQDEDGFSLADAVRLAGVSSETGARIGAYIAALDEWRTRLNLIGPGEGRHVWRRHVYDSLQLVPLIRDEERAIADLGSGAGFPGIVLSCAFPDRDIALVEKSPRKAEFLRAAVKAIGTTAVVLNQRAEDPVQPPARPGKPAPNPGYDLVTARALSPLAKLLGQARPWVRPGGRLLFVKGGGATTEISLARDSWDFHVEALESQTSPDGRILVISGLTGRS